MTPSSSKFENYQQGLLGAEAFGRKVEPEEPKDGTSNLTRQDHARFLVMVYINGEIEKNDQKRHKFREDEVFVVWFSKTLENWKALIGTTLNDRKYYEVTHNGAKKETYVDVYVKVDNVVFPDES